MKHLIKKHDIINKILSIKYLWFNNIDSSSDTSNNTVSVLNLVLYLTVLLMILPVITALLMIYLGIF